MISSNNTCVLCSSLPHTTGTANAQGCVCASGYVWGLISYACISNTCSGNFALDAATQRCTCDVSRAITDGLGNCVLCSAYANSNGVPTSPTACGCSANYAWKYLEARNNGSCECATNCGPCDPATSVKIGTLCYNCTKVALSLGPVANTDKCSCPSHLVWSWSTTLESGACVCSDPLKIASSTACACNTTISLSLSNGNCLNCSTLPSATGLTVTIAPASPACVCLSNFTWNENSRGC